MSFPVFSDCIWRIKVPTDRYISLRFLEFTGINGANSECSLDSIEVRDGYSITAPLIGNISQTDLELYSHIGQLCNSRQSLTMRYLARLLDVSVYKRFFMYICTFFHFLQVLKSNFQSVSLLIAKLASIKTTRNAKQEQHIKSNE